MKYEVGKAYIHDGSEECPLPEGSRASILLAGGATWENRDADIWDWSETGTSDSIVAFVPTYIPPQPREWWLAIISKPNDRGPVGGAFLSEADAESRLEQSFYDWTIVRVREVTE